jgi:hypothetical protein
MAAQFKARTVIDRSSMRSVFESHWGMDIFPLLRIACLSYAGRSQNKSGGFYQVSTCLGLIN